MWHDHAESRPEDTFTAQRRRIKELEARVEELENALGEYGLWRPCEKGHAAAHRRLMFVARRVLGEGS